MATRISDEKALELLKNVYLICTLTNNFSLSAVLDRNNCNGYRTSLVSAGMISALKTKGSWKWNLDTAPTIEDARLLLAIHYCETDDIDERENQMKLGFYTSAEIEILAEFIVNKICIRLERGDKNARNNSKGV